MQVVVALTIETGAGPVIIKSLPSGATELQSMGVFKIILNSSGAHFTGTILSYVGNCGGNKVKVTWSPMVIGVPQLSSKVLPSVPFFMVMV